MKTVETANGNSVSAMCSCTYNSVENTYVLRPKRVDSCGPYLQHCFIGWPISNEWENKIFAVKHPRVSGRFSRHNSGRCLPRRMFPAMDIRLEAGVQWTNEYILGSSK